MLQAVVPALAAVDPILAIWLTGSLARQEADVRSSVDCCLLWSADAPDAARRRDVLQAALSRALGDGGFLLDQCPHPLGIDSFEGITLAPNPAGSPGLPVAEGVLFRFHCAASTMANELRRRAGPVTPLYLSERLPGEQCEYMKENSDALGPPDAEAVGAQLARFWILLAQLPAILGRQENLAAHALLGQLRSLLIDLVVALNGVRRPQAAARINQYLGPAQREAFEKSLGAGRALPGGRPGNASWIGQAVALVVLYRWYAPQLAENYATPYPQPAEETVLNLLRTQVDGWPAEITTA